MSDDDILGAFLDTLLPGDDVFPSATASGMRALASDRMGGLADVLAAALAANGWLVAPPEQAVAATAAAEPSLFDAVRKIAYLTYYEQPPVLAAIRALGFAYNDAPLPNGYPEERFDPGTDAPRHHRGRWIATDDVTRIELPGEAGGRT